MWPLWALVIVTSTAPLSAQEPAWPRVLRLTPRDTAPSLDGYPGEAIWLRADSIVDFTQRDPSEGSPASERTVVRLLAADAGLWIGIWAYDRTPDGIRHAQLRRDADFETDDHVTVAIDAMSDRRSGFLFSVNPNGAIADAEIITFENENPRWDGIWDARARITSEGWFVEALIPWQTLRYPTGATGWGLNVQRFIRRKNEFALWRAWRRGEGIRFLEREGRVEGLAELPGRARVELRPYALTTGRLPERRHSDTAPDSILASSSLTGEVGIDAKLPVSNTLTLDLTYNTDFAQAEVDQQVVNLTRFPVFFPETRQFFNEGAGIFDFGRLRETQLFYSRRIGLREGRALPIVGGARLTGRAGRQQVGALLVRTGGDDDATDFAARIKRDILGRGYVGAMATGREARDAPASVVGGLDVNLPYIVGGKNLVFIGSTAWHRDSTSGTVSNYSRLVVDFPNDVADLVARYDRVGEGFEPALGFVAQSGIQRFAGNLAYTPRPRRWGIRRFDFSFGRWDWVSRLDGSLDNAELAFTPLGADFESGDSFSLQVQRSWDVPRQAFEIFPGSVIPAGRYSWDAIELQVDGSEARAIVPEFSMTVGELYDGRRIEWSLALGVRREPHVLLSAEYERTRVTRGSQGFTASVARLRSDYAVSPRLNTTLFAQYDNETERVSVNARLRYTRSPGSDLYVVWNSGWPSGLERGIPWSRPTRGALVVKYVQYLRR
ncbi:MAG: carbohydrate binding family 9 domain-containing protein [Gemmatimonadaceae bacterium]|nr:carbohydrate binding family 9 domain-containing protein [Gemmatimonadaceae bacterium]